jgi:ATP/maltotriose-dependent transcriptional regulator MalT
VTTHTGPAPLVGRDSELEQLDAALDAVDRGDAACVAVEGEAGIGKTRLLVELRDRADARGHVVLSGAAAEFERDLPFSVLVDALDAYVLSHDLRDREAWDADLERELAQILPSLGGDRREAGVVADERYRTHRALRRLLAAIAAERPLVLMLDDLQWSDGASAEVISALIRRRLPPRTLLALGFRPGRAAERLAGALADPRVTRLVLGHLTEDESTSIFGRSDPEVAKAIYRLAGGNPFYLEQLGRAGVSGAFLRASDGATIGVPPAVGAAIAGELLSLPRAARRFLDAAAIAGEPFEPELAAAIAELPEGDGLAALDELLDLDIVRPTDIPRRFIFRHPLMRRAVYESTGGGWRLAAHARAAAALEAAGRAPAERAHHVEHSARPGDEAAIDVLLQAGRAAAGRAPATAARWFGAAQRLLPSADVERQVTVLVQLASARRSAGDLDGCRAALLEAMAMLGPDAVARRVELTALTAAVEHWQGHHADAHRRLQRAWEELPEHRTPEAAALQIELAVDGLYEQDFEKTFEMGEAALETARSLDDAGLVATAAAALALGEAAAGRTDAARNHRREALGRIERLEDPDLATRLEIFFYLGWAETYLEHYEEAIAHADRGLALARATGQGRLLVPLMLLRGYPMEMQGRLAEAREICETAVEISRLSANPHYLYWALSELGWALYYAGDLDGVIAAGEESIRVGGRAVGGTMPSSGGGSGWTLAVAWFELGQPERARGMMYEVGGEGMTNWIPAERCFNWENLALVELVLGNVETADAIAARAEEQAAELVPLNLPTVLAKRTRAAVDLAAGDPAGAARAAEASVTAATALGASLQVAYSRSVLGRALAAMDDRRGAVAALREAERELDTCGSVRVRDEVRRELRRLGARSEARGPSAADGSGIAALTQRESEISGLIADRLTNKEIAAQLFLSEKTVETHIRNVFHKLGASSRVDVARIVERDRREREAAGDRL